ncbi:DUF1080 domain-containing protein [Singulisphaera sp. Ch08]|uniref:DUF1080 domain-containing protein n=1 Tax=Singulisphaera sp. Ch08 TaxID=3120278 RepID=A0AAU7CC41_9BACT
MRISLLLSLALLVSVPANAADHELPPGFTALFNGRSLEGWSMVNTKDNFFVKDGILVLNKGEGWLASDKTFSDFELRIRYRFVTPGTDSGVYIRAGLEGKNWPSQGYQIQNMDDLSLGKVVRVKGNHNVDVLKRVKKATGEWQLMTIVARGKSATIALNGEEVASTENLTLLNGRVGLQAERGILEFERIDIKPLP